MRVEEFRPIDGLSLSAEYRALLRPGEAESDWAGTLHRLPRFFYEIGSWQDAQAIRLAPHFYNDEQDVARLHAAIDDYLRT